MKTFAINTLGCKVNQYESQQARELLEKLGLEHLDGSGKPELVIINTCCVTHTASAKSRQYIRKAQKLNPQAVMVVVGCLPAVEIGELNGFDAKNVHIVKSRDALAAALTRIVNNAYIKTENPLKIKPKNKLNASAPELAPLTTFKGQTRAFMKVQDGCDGHCSYCIIPKTRPSVRSKPAEEALREAKALVEAGHREIVVIGIFLGAYGQTTVRRKYWLSQQNDKLAELLDKMAELPALERIRLSSLEPADVTPRLLDTFCRHRNIMPHIHLSLQSGSDAILKKMCRQYTAEEFARTVELIKSRLDRPALTADIIVGFPGETDADFEATIKVARQTKFAKMHIFRFSPRRGTAAAAMQDAVDNEVIKKRSQILRRLDIELGRNFRRQFVGETAMVLLENGNGQPCGRSERYFMVHLQKSAPPPLVRGRKAADSTRGKKNELVRVKLVKNSENGAIGEVLSREPRPHNDPIIRMEAKYKKSQTTISGRGCGPSPDG